VCTGRVGVDHRRRRSTPEVVRAFSPKPDAGILHDPCTDSRWTGNIIANQNARRYCGQSRQPAAGYHHPPADAASPDPDSGGTDDLFEDEGSWAELDGDRPG